VSRPHALITGGSSGIGLALARRLAASGHNLTLIARRAALLEDARAELASQGGSSVEIVAADVSVREQAEAAVQRALDALGAPSLLVTSAGMARPGHFDELPVEVFERTLAVNYLGTLYVVKAALPAMKAARRGRIVMISSGAGLIGIFGYTAYSSSKFALRGLAESLHAELRDQGIGVSIAFPPDTDTPQLAEENRTKPAETRAMTARAGVWSAAEVADRILRGAERDDFAITPGWQLSALYRFGGLITPLLR
jgi:3-dehydrosphinganine reductase